jgi:hypothetical protein
MDMVIVVLGVAWLVSALLVGSLIGRSIRGSTQPAGTDRTATGAKPLYVADILRAYQAAEPAERTS